MMPSGWNSLPLGEVVNYKKGFAFKSENFKDSGRRIIRISDTTASSIKNESPVFVNEDNSLKDFELNPSDIILTTVGSRPPLYDSMVGKAIKVPPTIRGAYLNQNLVKLIPNEKVDHEFLFLKLKEPRFISYISTLVRGNANQVSITLDELFNYQVILPSKKEQQKIAKILSTWDEAIEKLDRLIQTSDMEFDGLLKKTLRNPTFCSSHVLAEVADITMGASPKSSSYNSDGNGLPLIQGNADIKNRRSFPKQFTSEITKECRTGDILFSVRAPVGMVAISDHHACIGRGVSAIRAKNNINQVSLYYSLLASESSWKSLSQGSTFEAINSSDLKAFEVAIPNNQYIGSIEGLLKTADQNIAWLKLKRESLILQKKGLMQQLLTGKKRVRV